MDVDSQRIIASIGFLLPFLIGFGFFLPGAVILAKVQGYLMRHKAIRDAKTSQTIIAEYVAPSKFSPAELGFMYDGVFGEHEINATLVDFTQRGLLIVKQTPEGKRYCTLEVRPPTSLKPFEEEFFSLISSYEQGISQAEILKGKVLSQYENVPFRYIDMTGYKYRISQMISNSLAKQGYYDLRSLVSKQFNAVFIITILIGTIGAIIQFISLSVPSSVSGIEMIENGVVVEQFSLGMRIMFAILIGGVFNMAFGYLQVLITVNIYNRLRGFGPNATKKLKDMWPDIEGYKLFLKTVELERFNFELEQGNLANNKPSSLPFGLALGLPINTKNNI